MSDLPYTRITTTGPDAFEFLQAQLAADINLLADTDTASIDHGNKQRILKPELFAWCNPKGRVICLFRVSRTATGYMLMLPNELADDVHKRLVMFRFRAKVEFELGAVTAQQLGIETGFDDWRLENLRNGIVEIGAAQTEQWTPHMLNLDLLGAVSIDKGCYPGQEIVSRTHYRGKTKRRLLRFTCAAGAAVGDKVSDGDRDVGEVVNAIADELLAVVPLDKQNQRLTIGSNELIKCSLPYLQNELEKQGATDDSYD